MGLGEPSNKLLEPDTSSGKMNSKARYQANDRAPTDDAPRHHGALSMIPGRQSRECDRKVPDDYAIEFRDITHRFRMRKTKSNATEVEYTAVRDCNLRIERGEFVSIVGPTGCGKSTILNIAAGLIKASSGMVTVLGAPLAGINPAIGYMFQNEPLMPWRTALRNVTLGLEYRGIPTKDAMVEGECWLSRVGLEGFGNSYMHQLSGGMRRRVALAQMLIMNPSIILMDEPFSALDAQTRVLMENELLDIWAADRKSVLFVTHDIDEAISISDRVVILSAGPGTHPIGEFDIDLPRPRDVSEIRHTEAFIRIFNKIWDVMKVEVLKGYSKTKAAR